MGTQQVRRGLALSVGPHLLSARVLESRVGDPSDTHGRRELGLDRRRRSGNRHGGADDRIVHERGKRQGRHLARARLRRPERGRLAISRRVVKLRARPSGGRPVPQQPP